MVLVTGASGFLGKNLVEKLLSLDIPTRVLVRDPKKFDIIHRCLEVFEGNILDVSSLDLALKDIDTIYHCAAMISYHYSDRDEMYKTNVEGTANLINLSLLHKVKKFIHISSIAAIGAKHGSSLIDESTKWETGYNHTQYGISKMMAEREVYRGIAEGLNACIICPGVIIGKSSNEAKSTNKVIAMIKKGLRFYPKGTNGFVGIDDTVAAILKLGAIDNCGERYIVVSENMSIKEFFQKTAKALNSPPPNRPMPDALISIALIADSILSKFLFKPRFLSKENLKLAQLPFYYDNKKASDILQIKWKSIEQSIQESIL